MQVAYPIEVAEENPKQEESGQTATAQSPRQAHRRAKLKALLKDHDGIQAVAKNESERTYLQSVLSSKRGLGDRKAAELEARYGLEPGWFDAPFNRASDWPFAGISLQRVLGLDPVDLGRLEGRVSEAIAWVESTSVKRTARDDTAERDGHETDDEAAREDAIAQRSEFGFNPLHKGNTSTRKKR